MGVLYSRQHRIFVDLLTLKFLEFTLETLADNAEFPFQISGDLGFLFRRLFHPDLGDACQVSCGENQMKFMFILLQL